MFYALTTAGFLKSVECYQFSSCCSQSIIHLMLYGIITLYGAYTERHKNKVIDRSHVPFVHHKANLPLVYTALDASDDTWSNMYTYNKTKCIHANKYEKLILFSNIFRIAKLSLKAKKVATRYFVNPLVVILNIFYKYVL